MAKRCLERGVLVVTGLLLGGLGSKEAVAQELSEQARQQIRAIYADKGAWTPAQRKLATSLLYASRESRGQAMVQGLQPLRRIANRARVDGQGMVTIDIRGDVTDDLLRAIADLGGAVLSSQPAFRAVRARVSIRGVEALAALPEVQFIGPQQRFLVNTGSQTSQGDIAHAAAAARSTYGIDGTGVKIGVLSDGVDSLAARQATGDLPPMCASPPGSGACVAVVVPQCAALPCGGDGGTAMMEIVHDLAPGAQIYFAGTGETTSEAQFAANVLTLRETYGCDIIVDDITFLSEGAFQDGPIAQAVNTVTARGALFFSAAGDSGRLNAGTSGTWEGDYQNSNTVIPVFDSTFWRGLQIHSWNGRTGASAANSNQITADAPFALTLKWSDPLGKAITDYDLLLLDSGLTTIMDGSATDQTVGGKDPYEEMGSGAVGERIVVVRWSGPAKALRLDTNRGQLSLATRGAVVGHNGAESTVTVAAAGVSSAGGGAFAGGATNPVETYSSDGPRRMFYNPNGTAITPGNVQFDTGGGREIRKPDITAADCVTTAFPVGPPLNLSPFCGTSAAAAHAAAIAALLKSAPNHPSTGQVLTAMFTTALDVDPTGRDRDSGVGIVMANAAAGALTNVPAVDFYTVSPCRVFDTRSAVPPLTTQRPLTCGVDYDFTMVGGTCGVPPGAKAVSLNVTVTAPSAPGNLRFFAAGSPAPLVSTLNYSAGETRANNAVAPLGASGRISLRCAPSGTAHVIVDVNGYFQ